MMHTIRQYLTLRGFAYVQKLTRYSDPSHLTVALQCLPVIPIKDSRQELLLITCVVEDERFIQQLQTFHEQLSAQDKLLIVEFTAKYLGTAAVQHCSHLDDPEQIVNISARLMAIHAMYMDSTQPSEQSLALAI